MQVIGTSPVATRLRSVLQGKGMLARGGDRSGSTKGVVTVIADDIDEGEASEIRTPWILVGRQANEELLFWALRQGAVGLLSAEASDQETVEAILRVATGRGFVDPALALRVLRRVALGLPPADASARWGLRNRELQALELLVQGRSTHEISSAMGIRVTTTKTYLRSLLRKVGARDRAEAVAIVLTTPQADTAPE